jgi:eukaryotic-like serine/threonine-protein kinase
VDEQSSQRNDHDAPEANREREGEPYAQGTESSAQPHSDEVVCLVCGGPIRPDDIFCPHCGAELVAG